MALFTLRYKSKQLSKETEVRILLNENAKAPYPTYYLLHGYSDDASNWTRNSSLEMHAAKWPYLIVMPDAAHSFYCDSLLGNYESYIIKELIPFIDKTFPTRKQKRYRAIGGLSMGGYGSLKLGLKYPDLFGSIASHSSATRFMHWKKDKDKDWLTEKGLVLNTAKFEENDPEELAAATPKAKLPKIYFDCGKDDFLLGDNNSFHNALLKRKIPHTYKKYSGAHSWTYWDEHINDAFEFVGKAMNIKKS